MKLVNNPGITVCSMSLVLLLQACAEGQSLAKTLTQSVGCAAGGAGGYYLAKMLAKADEKRSNLSPSEAKKRERGYKIGLAMIGCAGGAILAGTAYGKLSERGKKRREQEMLAAVATATPRTYRDPENPKLEGRITPQPVYADASGSRECRNVEDYLADAGKGEPIIVKYCRSIPSGDWKQVTV